MSESQSVAALPMLSSPQNQRVKDYVELRTDGNLRREKKRFFLEGRRGVATALALPHVLVHEVIFSDHILNNDLELVQQAQDKHIPLVRVSKDVFKKIADVMTPQGIAAVVKIPEWDLDDFFSRKDALIVIACGLQDPGNLGTLIRSCEAAGATALVTLEGTADPFNAKVVRATAAALLTLPILRLKTDEFLNEADKHHMRLVATAPGRRGSPAPSFGGDMREAKAFEVTGLRAPSTMAKFYREFDWKKRPIALCIGSEGDGLPAAIEAACKEKVSIPMQGQVESLNAAVAASILLFQAQE